ncbi:hypothetical protein LCM20_09230 [Halobacillus litoralis]|uniref:hypothetical protein n=1 Tax=Halobacillus litoralis TaxID=45668 RepID=UPI001CD6E71A|nr:hypothetical protein [Halobacillus litoralis]MCA0970770.1 hypothetical protein [Halobacillus litoralis]
MNEAWLKIQQQVKQDFFTFIEKEELTELAQISGKVPGFSKKRVSQAPEPLLRKAVTEMVESITDLEHFFQTFSLEMKDELEDADYATFLLKTSLNDELSPVKKLMLLAVWFPEQYEETRGKAIENIENGKDVFHGMQEFSLEDLLNVYNKKFEEDFVESLELFIEGDATLPESIDFADYFEEQYDDVTNGHALRLIQQYDWEDETLSAEETALLYKLALTESLTIAKKQKSAQTAELKLALDEQAAAVSKEKKVAKRKEILIEKLKEKDEETKVLKEEHDKAYRELEKKYSVIEEERNRFERERDTLQEERDQFEHREKQAKSDKLTFIDEEDPFHLITSNSDSFTSFIPDRKVLSFNPDRPFAEQFKSLPQSKLVIIDSNQLTSKQMLKIRSFLHTKKLSHKFVSGSPEKMFRSMIYYLEGDGSDEQ